MKSFFALLCLTFCSLVSIAQGVDKSRVQAIKTSFISDRLKLSPQQAQQFWPLYNNCQNERRNLRNTCGGAAAKAGQDPEEAMRFLDNNMECKQKDLSVQKRCNEDYLKVITPQQAAALVDAERDFKKMLLDELRKKQ